MIQVQYRQLTHTVFFSLALMFPSYTFANKSKSILEVLKTGKVKAKISAKDPYYPAFMAAQNLINSKTTPSRKIISNLESLLTKVEFKGNINTSKVSVGTLGSHSLWRDTIYLVLGRAYYEVADFEKAYLYYKGIQEKSVLAPIAFLEKGWTELYLKKYDTAEDTIKKIESSDFIKLSKQQSQQLVLQKMYLSVQKGDYNEAFSKKGQLNTLKNKVLEGLKHKILAQGYFDKYLKEMTNESFDKKVSVLDKILSHASRVPKVERDPEFSFLASEAFWHKASTLRVERPIAGKKEWTKLLTLADQWIKTWVDKSINGKKALISEEAMFFSIALQWEREKFSSAVNRLKALPRLFPQGEYLEDTFQLLGDFYFDQNKFDKAVTYYRKLSNYGDAQKASYGVYKAAWSFYNMDKKWKSLRHFERLMMFYEKQIKELGDEFEKNDKVGLIKETQRDFLSVLAELLDYKNAIRELRIFKFKDTQLVNYQTLLAGQYTKMGKFDDSAKTYRFLLRKYPDHSKGLSWLQGLLENHLASGKRKKIALDLDRFYPAIKAKGTFKSEEYSEFQKALSTIILTTHKEARKTDDMRIWVAIDGLYKSYMKHFKESEDGDIWYFGAQRQERLGRKWDAIQWYYMASNLEKYANVQDASLSVLRILKEELDRLTLDKKTIKNGQKNFAKISEFSKWYFETFPKTKQKELAQYLYVEALYYNDKVDLAKNYLVKEFNANKNDSVLWNLFLGLNKHFYDRKRWADSNSLAEKMLDTSDSFSDKNLQFVKNVFQETAFLAGLQKENRLKKVKKNSEKYTNLLAEVRQWYRKALKVSPDKMRELKAWANLIYSFDGKDKEEFLGVYNDFASFYKDKINLKNKYKKIFFDIYAFGAKVSENRGYYFEKANFLGLVQNFSDDIEQRKALLWESMILYGSYQDFDNVKKTFSIYRKSFGKDLNDSQVNQLARVYLYGEDYKNAWALLKLNLKKKKTIKSSYVLLGDIYRLSYGRDPINEKVSNYLKTNNRMLIKQDVLKPIWASLYQNDFSTALEKWKNESEDFKLSSISIKDAIKFHNENSKKKISKITKSQLALNRLKIRLADISRINQRLAVVKKSINQYIVSWKPQIAKQALCYSPVETQRNIELFRDISSQKIESPQWGAFVKKLNNEISGLKKQKRNEIKSCQNFSKEVALLDWRGHKPNLLCSFGTCLQPKKISPEELISKESDFVSFKNSEKKIMDLLASGAFSKAELFIYQLKKSLMRNFYLGLVRLGVNDSWNAYPIFEESLKNKRLKKRAKLYLSLIHAKGGERKVVLRNLKGAKAKGYNEIDRSYFKSIVKKMNDERKAKRSTASQK